MTSTKQLEMFVRLVMPDNIALTAKHTLLKMGFKLADLRREDYFRFEADAKNTEELKNLLAKTDVLANANKHKVSFDLERDGTKILVTEIDNTSQGLLHTLRERLGFAQIHAASNGTLWTFIGCTEEDAVKMTKELLINEHYQEFRVLQ